MDGVPLRSHSGWCWSFAAAKHGARATRTNASDDSVPLGMSPPVKKRLQKASLQELAERRQDPPYRRSAARQREWGAKAALEPPRWSVGSTTHAPRRAGETTPRTSPLPGRAAGGQQDRPFKRHAHSAARKAFGWGVRARGRSWAA